MKGFDEPVPAWRVDGESTAESRFEALHGERLTPLIGREHEIGLLLERFERAKYGEGQVVLLPGEPGIGKSRVVRALCERLQGEAYTYLRHFCSPFHANSAFYPIVGLIERMAGFAREDALQTRLNKLEAFLERVPGRLRTPFRCSRRCYRCQAATDIRPSAWPRKRRSSAPSKCWSTCWPGWPISSPCWRSMRICIGSIHRHSACWTWWWTRSEACGACRPHLSTRVRAAVARSRPRHVVAPGALGAPAGRLHRGGDGGQELPAEILDQIVTKTDGVPLFIEELTKSLLESELLREAKAATS